MTVLKITTITMKKAGDFKKTSDKRFSDSHMTSTYREGGGLKKT